MEVNEDNQVALAGLQNGVFDVCVGDVHHVHLAPSVDGKSAQTQPPTFALALSLL